MRRIGLIGVIVCLSMVCGSAGCYRTTVQAPQAEPSGPVYEDRQWFTAGGLLRVSGAAGSECGASGLSYAESLMSGTDIAINIGLTLAGSMLGAGACDSEAEPREYAACIQGFTALVPFLLSTRTVTYACAARPGTVGGKLPLLPGQKDQPAPTSEDSERVADKQPE